MNTTYINEIIYKELNEKYNKSTINKKELAEELGVSISSINQYIVKGYGIPEYKKFGSGKNAKVLFPIVCVAKYLSSVILVA